MKKLGWILSIIFSSSPLLHAATPTSDDYYKAASGLYAKQQYDLAIRYYQAAIQSDPNHWQAYQGLGTAFYQKKDYRNASAYFDKSLSLHPDNPSLKQFNDKLKGAHTEWAQVPVSVPEPTTTPFSRSPSQSAAPTPLPEEHKVRGNSMEERVNWGNKFWGRGFLGLNNCGMGDLTTAAASWNAYYKNFTTSATVQTTGLAAGAESGYMLDAHDTISISADVLLSGSYKSHVNDNFGTSRDQTVDPIFLGAEANYYRYFLLDFGRFYVGAGAGLGTTTVHYTYTQTNGPNSDGYFTGEGFVGSGQLGGEVYLNRRYSVEFSVKGRTAQFSKVTGMGTDPNTGASGSAALLKDKNGLLHAYFESSMSAYGYSYVPIDFSGFDLRVSVDYYF